MRLIKKFISYYKPHRRLFIIDMICAFVVAGCDLFYPMIAKNIINDYVPNQQLRLLLVWALALVGIYAVKAILNFIVEYWGHIVGVRIQADMRRDIFQHLQKLPFTYFDNTKTGTIMSRMINDLMDISELAHHGPEDFFLSVIMFIGAFIMLALINVPLTLIIFAFVPLIVFFAVKMRHNMHDAFKKTREEIGEVNANVETSIAGIRVSRAYASAWHEIKLFGEANKRFVAARGRSYKVMGMFHSGMNFLMDILYLAVLVAGGLFFYKGWIDAGEFAAYLLYINMFLKPINRFVSLFEQLQNGITGLGRFEEIMSVAPEQEKPDAIEVGALQGKITFDDVSFSYAKYEDSEKFVLNHLSMNIEKGRTVALVGPSGGGKTTLCNLIPRFYELDGGRILIDDVDICDMTRLSLRQNIGIVAQDVFLFNGTVRENIAYGDFAATDEQIIEAARKANIHDFIMTLENGYETNVGERGVKLSGGQKQRVSIARAFLKNPAILILDEATSALDNATEIQIQRSLEELSRGRTSIIVAHRLSTVKNADEIIVLTEDGVKERGTHEQLLAKDGMYAELYRYQFKE